MLKLFLIASLLPSNAALRTTSPKSWDDAIADAEILLSKECGHECVQVLHSVVNASGAQHNVYEGNGGKDVFVLNSMSDRGLAQIETAQDLMKAVSAGTIDAGTSHRHMAGMELIAEQARSKDTACGTPAECALRELATNKCNYGRVALQTTYNSLNVVAHVMGALVSSLCGCVHVQQVSHCILQNVPPMCTFPYTVYSKVFAGSVQVWEAVKASTKSCMVHRGPAIQR